MLAAISIGIGVQPEHRRLEHGERFVDGLCMLLAIAFACGPFFRSRRLEHRALAPCLPPSRLMQCGGKAVSATLQAYAVWG
jgi:hypothetical protein